MSKKLDKFPYDHVVKYDTQEVWVKCDSAITAMGVGTLVKMFYPGYKPKIASQEYLEQLRNQLVN
jgi:hypothetical protein